LLHFEGKTTTNICSLKLRIVHTNKYIFFIIYYLLTYNNQSIRIFANNSDSEMI